MPVSMTPKVVFNVYKIDYSSVKSVHLISPLTESTKIGFLKTINAFRVWWFCIKIDLFSHFCVASDIRSNIFHFWANLDFLQKSFITLTTTPNCFRWWTNWTRRKRLWWSNSPKEKSWPKSQRRPSSWWATSTGSRLSGWMRISRPKIDSTP